MTPRLRAVQFIRFMTSGRTGPVLLGCEDDSGTAAGEYVVKLKAGIERGERGLLAELVAARLAQHFQIAMPEPAIIQLEPDAAEVFAQAAPRYPERFRESVGPNFGTKVVTGFGIWPVDNPVPDVMLDQAASVFAFDALIDNPDRRFNNPNLFVKGDRLLVFDHELAFSFLLAIGLPTQPWTLEGQSYLQQHALYRGIRGRRPNWAQFSARLKDLADGMIAGIDSDVPPQWRGGDIERIGARLRVMRDHADTFMEAIRRFIV